MLDTYMEKQKIVYHMLKNTISKNRTSHAYLFETNGYEQALDVAIAFSKTLLCPYKYTESSHCKDCSQCKNIDKNCFLELKIIRSDGMWIKKEQLDELQKEFSMKSVESDLKVYIIEEAEKLNSSSANTILKFLEEPADNIVAILLTNNAYQVLETITSRCQIISFNKSNDFDQMSYDEKLKKLISIPEELETLEQVKEKVDSIVNFIFSVEKNRLETILYTQKMWHENISGKEMNLFSFEILTLFYKDLLNRKIGRSLLLFEDNETINKLYEQISLEEINRKLKVILDLKEQIKYNANATLLIDRLIMDLVGGVS